MKMRKISRRQFIAASLLAAPALVLADVKIEPTWLKVRHVRIGSAKPTCRLVHFTDVHHKGDTAYLQDVVNQINSLAPDFVCFTGDIMEDGRYLKEALELFAEIKTPLYGVPGNHDYWSRAKFGAIQKSFATTGGGWLLDQTRTVGSDINLIGITCTHPRGSKSLPAKNLICSWRAIPMAARSESPFTAPSSSPIWWTNMISGCIKPMPVRFTLTLALATSAITTSASTATPKSP